MQSIFIGGIKLKKHIANIITGCRILFSILMLLFPVYSVQFYVLYFLSGFSDMIDGTIARKTNSISEFGAQFDTIADFIFVIVSLIRFLPIVHIPKWLWLWIVIIAIIKVSNTTWVCISKKQFIFVSQTINN